MGLKLRVLMVEKGMTNKELARLTGISEDYIWMMRYDKCNPTLEKIRKVAKALGVKATDVID